MSSPCLGRTDAHQVKRILSTSTFSLDTHLFTVVNLLMFSKSAWKPFKRHFNQTLDKIREHRKNVEKEATISHMLEAKHARELEITARLEIAAQKRGWVLSSLDGCSGFDNNLPRTRAPTNLSHAVNYKP